MAAPIEHQHSLDNVQHPGSSSAGTIIGSDIDKSEFVDPEERERLQLLAKKDWTPEEERAAKRKVDMIVMPLLIVSFFFLQLDRGNMGNALTDNFLKDIHITQNQWNVGQQLLYLGIVLLEVPANVILYRLGPQRWLSMQIMAWGLVSTFQAFQTNYGGFLATRLLLGFTEGGFIPGGLFVISSWYTRVETAKRFSIYFIGNLSASATTGLISFGILHMRGVAGLSGWQWLFLISGMATVVTGVVMAFFMPGLYDDPSPWLLPRLRYFSERELYILKWRVIIDSPSKGKKSSHISFAQLKSALSNWRIYPHMLITLCAAAPVTAVNSYAPSLVYGFGYNRLRANALASVGSFILIVTSTLWGFFSDYTGKRALAVISALVFALAAISMNAGVASTNDKSLRYGAITFYFAFGIIFHPQNGAWLAVNNPNPQDRAIAMALFISAANASGIVGGQLFRSDDAPHYTRAFAVCAALVSVGLAAALCQAYQYWWTARRNARAALGSASASSDGSFRDEKAGSTSAASTEDAVPA